MTVAEILKSVNFVVNPKGNKSTALEHVAVWKQIVAMLEDAEDEDKIKHARTIHAEQVPWNVAKKELKLGV